MMMHSQVLQLGQAGTCRTVLVQWRLQAVACSVVILSSIGSIFEVVGVLGHCPGRKPGTADSCVSSWEQQTLTRQNMQILM